MKINSNTDFSMLISSLNKNDSSTNFLSDYASIKNGSYGKMMKAYYGNVSKDSATVTSKDKKLTDKETKNLSDIKAAGDTLKKSIKGINEALFAEDDEKTVSAVKDFVSSYNDFVSSINDAKNTNVTKAGQNLINEIGASLKTLSKAGITLDKNGKMSVNEEQLKNNKSSVKALFGTYGSFGDSVDGKVSAVERKVNSELNAGKTYTASASYNNSAYIGKLYDSFN